MLFYSENRLIPTNVNMLVIQGDDGAYYYVHRTLYDQAVILNDKYGQRTDELLQILGTEENDIVNYFKLVVPKPLNILGYFLTIIPDSKKLPEEISDLCGVLHLMSAALNFRKMLQIPLGLRQGVEFSLKLTEEYKLSWDRFFQECIPYSEELFLSGAKAYAQQTQQTSSLPALTEDDYPVDDEEEDDGFSWDDFMTELDKDEDLKNPSLDSSASAPAQPEPQPEPEPEHENDGLDFLLNYSMTGNI